MIPFLRALLALLPAATLVFTAVALRPRAGGDLRLAAVRAAVAVAVGTVLGVELLSLLGWIAAGPVIAAWAVATLATGWLAWRRWPAAMRLATTDQRDGQTERHRQTERHGRTERHGHANIFVSIISLAARYWRDGEKRPSAVVRSLAAGVGVLVAAELVLALASSPNNFDSNHYHLAKIEHWISNGHVGNYPTVQTQQIILVPGAEFLLLQLRLLTGGDGQVNLLQWAAGLLGALAVARCAGQLGAGRAGQWLAAAVFLTAPAIVLESTSTQNDLIVTAWVACAATIALDAARRPATRADVLALAGASGLVFVTKSTGLMALLPVLAFWAAWQLRRRAFKPMLYGGLAVAAAVALLAGPSLLRVQQAFGSPFGPPGYRTALSTSRHDPPAVLVNGLRLGASTLLTPFPDVNEAIGNAVIGAAHLVHVDPNEPAITQWRSVFPGDRWKPDEDRSPYPVQSALALLAAAAGLCFRRTRGYAALVLGALVLTAAVVKWQDWGNRLILPAFAVGTPLAGYYLEKLTNLTDRPKWLRVTTAAGVALVMAAGLAHAYIAVFYGQPRRLVGQSSVFTLDDWQERFVRMPYEAAGYRTAIDQVRASGARRVGLVLDGDLWGYPLQYELRGRDLVELQSQVPSEPPAAVSSVQAIICVSNVERCRRVVPQDWQFNRIDGFVTTAFPPR
jgi:hypothetical protein